MILEFEFIPEQCRGKNLEQKLAPEVWDLLKKKSYKNAEYKCQICDEKLGRLECHETWDYRADEYTDRPTQYLLGLRTLCEMCHRVKTINLKASPGNPDRRKMNEGELIEHFNKVNNCSGDTYEVKKREALEECNRREARGCDTSFGEYTALVKLFPKPITDNCYTFSCKLDR